MRGTDRRFAGFCLTPAQALTFGIFGGKPTKLPETQSIYSLSMVEVTVNNETATLKTRINPGDTVETARNSEVIFVVNSHSMILRSESKLVIEKPDNSIGHVHC